MSNKNDRLPDSQIEKAKSDIVATISKYVELKSQGVEYRAICPFHHEKTPSFSVVPEKAMFYCHGCGAGGDAIDFVEQFENVSFRDAVKRIVGDLPAGEVVPIKSARKEDKPEWVPVVPVPVETELRPMDIFNRRSGDEWQRMVASKRWPYLDADGRLIGYICRFELPGGGKDVIPQSFCVNTTTGEMSWRWVSFDKPRPLYGLDLLAANPTAQVLLVEGEKTCDAARELLKAAGVPQDKLLAVSWPGGGKAVEHTDWAALLGRSVALWPDADLKAYKGNNSLAGMLMPLLEQPGMQAMLKVAKHLDGMAALVKIIMPPEDVPDGWDLADDLPAGFNLLDHMRAAAMPLTELYGKFPSAVNEDPGVSTALATISELPSAANRDEERRRQQQEANEQLQEAEAGIMFPSKMTVPEMLSNLVWIAEGEQVAYVSPNCTIFLSYKEMRSLTAESTTYEPSNGMKKPLPSAVLWQRSPARREAMTRTFHAGADVICADPDGKRAVNTWSRIQRSEATVDISLFHEHIEYLFQDPVERKIFLDWLAHMEQKPGQLPHYGWLHVSKHTGCGRNWLASVLARVWRGYVAPNVDLPALLDSPYNGCLGGRILAIVDEVQEGAGENSYRHTNKLRSLVNAEYRDINPKFGRQYREHNSCRWLVFSNHLNALPIDSSDRRWRVVVLNDSPRTPEVYEQLYRALDDEKFINSIASFLAERDISAFKPGERPPMSSSKLAVVGAAKSLIQQRAEEVVGHWPSDIITNTDAATILSEGSTGIITASMRRSLEELGATGISRQIKINGKGQRAWIIRNHTNWTEQDNASIVKECQRARGGLYLDADAAVVLAERRYED